MQREGGMVNAVDDEEVGWSFLMPPLIMEIVTHSYHLVSDFNSTQASKGKVVTTRSNKRREQPLPEACLAVWRYHGHWFQEGRTSFLAYWFVIKASTSSMWRWWSRGLASPLKHRCKMQSETLEGETWEYTGQIDKSYSQRCWCICWSRAYHAKSFRPDTALHSNSTGTAVICEVTIYHMSLAMIFSKEFAQSKAEIQYAQRRNTVNYLCMLLLLTIWEAGIGRNE